MRILHVSHQYPPAIGGSEQYIADLSEALAARGHQVDVFTSRARDFHTWRNELAGFEHRQGVNIYRFTSLQRRRYVWALLHFGLRHYWRARARRWEPFIFLGGGPLCPGMIWRLWQQGRQYDVIHLNCLVYSHVAYSYWATRHLNVPVVVTPHAHAEQEVTYNVGYQRSVLKGCAHVLADTPAERDLMIQLGLSPDKVSVGGVGLRPEDYPAGESGAARQHLGLPETAFVLLFLGRKDAYKGLPIVLEAFATLSPHHPDLHLLAVGPETNDSRALWPRYNGLKNLHVLGTVSHVDKVAALQACDSLVLPSVGEAFGIVFLEAWIMGKPVIGARVLSVSSLIAEGQDGLLAAPGDPADLAQHILTLMENLAYRQTLGRAGRAKVLSHYTVARITDRVEKVYQQLVRRPPQLA